MRFNVNLSISLTKNPATKQPAEQEFEHRDNDTMVESSGPRRIGFTVDHSAEPYGPEEDRRRRLNAEFDELVRGKL